MAVMRAEDEPAPPTGEQKKLREQLITLIPSEAVVLYVAAIGAAAEASEGVRWLIFFLVLIFTPVWVVASYWEKKGGRTGIPLFEVVIGTVAFVAWTTTVPQGTFDDLGLAVWGGTIVVVVVSAALALAVRLKAVWAKKPNGPVPPPEPAPAPTG